MRSSDCTNWHGDVADVLRARTLLPTAGTARVADTDFSLMRSTKVVQQIVVAGLRMRHPRLPRRSRLYCATLEFVSF